MSVALSISSRAREYSYQRSREGRSIGLSFHCRKRILDARLESPLLLLVADFEPVLDQDDAVVDDVLFERGTDLEEAMVLLLGAEAHHALDAGAVVPTAVKDHDFAGGREVRHVALQVHLRSFRDRTAPAARRGGRRAG